MSDYRADATDAYQDAIDEAESTIAEEGATSEEEVSASEAASASADAAAEEALEGLRNISGIGGYEDLTTGSLNPAAYTVEGSTISVDDVVAAQANWESILAAAASRGTTDFSAQTTAATDAAIASTEKINAALSKAFYENLDKVAPGITDTVAAYKKTIDDMLAGKLPEDVEDYITQTSAELGLSQGQRGQIGRTRVARDLGLTSADMVTTGQGQMTNLSSVVTALMPKTESASNLSATYLDKLLGLTTMTPAEQVSAEQFNVSARNAVAQSNQQMQYQVASDRSDQALAVQEYNKNMALAIDQYNQATRWTAATYNQERQIAIDQFNAELDMSRYTSMLNYASDQQTNAANERMQAASDEAASDAATTAGWFSLASSAIGAAGTSSAGYFQRNRGSTTINSTGSGNVTTTTGK